MNTFPLNFVPEGAGDGRFYRTAGGEWIPNDGAWQFQGYDENGLLRSLNGILTGVHKVLCSAAEIACKGRQDFHHGHNGGYIIVILTAKLREMGEVAWEERTHSCPSRTKHFQFQPEPRSEINRDQQCERC